MSDKRSLQDRLEVVTKRWWFWLIVVLVQCVPPITSFKYDPSRTSGVIGSILGNAYAFRPEWRALYPVLNSLAIIMLAGVFIFRNRWGRAFALYAGLSYVLFAIVQNMAQLPNGYGIVANNAITFLLVGLVWFLEAGARKTDLRAMRFTPGRVWLIPLAAMAFWHPVKYPTMAPDFSPMHAIFGPTGVEFCLMTPAFLAVLILCYPRVNVVTLRVTGVFGTIIALYNIMFMAMYLDRLWWNGVLHTLMLVISLYAVVLGYKRQPAPEIPAEEATHAGQIERPVATDI